MNNPSQDNIPVFDGFAETGADPVSARGGMSAWLPAVLLLGLFWLLIFNQQRLEWTVNVVYAYGWAIPFLSGYLLWERWRSRPAAGTRLPVGAVVGIGLLLLAAYLPLRVIQEANPDWVKTNWSICGLASALTLTAFASIGGWPYVRNFFFPVVFCFTALPWPVWMEDWLVQGLMRMNASICAELLTWGGMPAMAEGNVIQIAGHALNVEEACSGIRSLQTAFMMALFLGEFYRMGMIRRTVMLLSSFAVALLINIGRTLVLAVLASHGTEEKWHDTVGNIAMVLCLVALWLLSDVMSRSPQKNNSAKMAGQSKAALQVFPLWFAAVGVIWLASAEVANAAWYSVHEKSISDRSGWTVKWPKEDASYRQGVLGDRTRSLLKYNDGETAEWSVDSGYVWQMYYLRWLPGRVSKFLSRSHYPTVCLPATGLKLVSEMGIWDCEVKGVHFPFATYVFDQDGRDVYVFHAILEDRPENPDERIIYRQVSSSERIDSVLRHERNLGQRVIGISLRGPISPIEARETVTSVMNRLIVKESPSPLAQSATP